jgi:hypothetical protein
MNIISTDNERVVSLRSVIVARPASGRVHLGVTDSGDADYAGTGGLA